MKQIHHQEKEQFQELFEHENIDHFEDRFKILEVFLGTEHHVTEQELNGLLRNNGYDFEAKFVKDTLNLMCRFGFAQKNEFDNGAVRYEHRHLGQHHDHLICTRCGKIVEFKDDDLEDLQMRIAASQGFHMLQHGLKIYGICGNCLRKPGPLIPLTMAKPREVLTVREVTGGLTSRMRLVSMGIRVGDKVEVISNSGKGQLVVALDRKRYALGRGMAQKILVRPEK